MAASPATGRIIMRTRPAIPQRRHLLRLGALLGAAATALPARLAAQLEALMPTPPQTRGPFYPEEIPLDADNDLVRVTGRPGIAQGIITSIGGRVLRVDGSPVAGARVEIWQCDAFGRYGHPRESGSRTADPDFQGYGHHLSDGQGGYRFRTIRPVPYPGRTPHIHFAVRHPDGVEFVTQMYVAGEPQNERDFLLNRIRDPEARARLIVPLVAAPADADSELSGRFDIVLPDA
jgi:protocatechuate 3,4-dioxygenase, beta subunit